MLPSLALSSLKIKKFLKTQIYQLYNSWTDSTLRFPGRRCLIIFTNLSGNHCFINKNKVFLPFTYPKVGEETSPISWILCWMEVQKEKSQVLRPSLGQGRIQKAQLVRSPRSSQLLCQPNIEPYPRSPSHKRLVTAHL